MLKPFTSRVEFIRELLNSTKQEIVLDGYDLLFELWLIYSSDNKFVEEVKIIAAEHVNLTQEFIKRVDKLSRSKEEKATLLRPIKSLLPTSPVKIFISYSHKDEPFKNELDIILISLQRRGIVGTWQDRRIEPGSEWLDLITKVIEECEMAILLVSPDFIASRFIQEKGLAYLFQRRIIEGLRVVPIIVRPCLWQDEPVIKDLQALPKNGKPVISFSKENGDRDQVWTEIGSKIEIFAKGS